MISFLRGRRIRELPIVAVLPHGGCNCRCVMCGYWEDRRDAAKLSLAELQGQAEALRRLRVRWFLFSGGEPLLHPDLFAMAKVAAGLGAKASLLTNGLLLARHADAVLKHFDEVIVSLDGDRETHDCIRGVPGCFDRLAAGVKALKDGKPGFPVTGRSVIQKANFARLPAMVDAAAALGLDRISFLPVDAQSSAFQRGRVPESLALDEAETRALRRVLKETFVERRDAFASGFVAESPRKLLRIAAHFEAANGLRPFEAPPCNAPWVCAVIEPDGAVRPCFFHPPIGRLSDGDLDEVINTERARAFRKGLRVKKNPVCRRCVCPLYWRG